MQEETEWKALGNVVKGADLTTEQSLSLGKAEEALFLHDLFLELGG